MEIRTTSRFEEQLTEILDYYSEIDPDLASAFLDRLRELSERLGRNPGIYPHFSDSRFRKALLHQFPYLIRYEIKSEHILFLTLRHGAQKPEEFSE